MLSACRLTGAASALAIGLAATPLVLQGQEGAARVCNLVESGTIDRQEFGTISLIELRDPFLFRCNDGTELRAQAGTLNQTDRRLELRGNVDFRDPFRTLTSDHATYESQIGRLHATGNVIFIDRQEGSELRGPDLEYFRPIPGRPDPQVHARGRPHLTLAPRGSGESAEPLEVDGDRITILGQDDLHADGAVVITRSDLLATSNVARYSGATGDLTLTGDAHIESGEYDLYGQSIEARLMEDAIDYVNAAGDARLVSSELSVDAPDLQLFFADELLQRAVARRLAAAQPRPVARSAQFRLEADSIDALVPGQRVDRVIAIGRARGESIDTTSSGAIAGDSLARAAAPETLRDTLSAVAGADPVDARIPVGAVDPIAPDLLSRDWIRGDTIIGYFGYRVVQGVDTIAVGAVPDSLAVQPIGGTPADGDTTRVGPEEEAVLERLLALGSALALHRIDRDDAAPGARPRVNFLAGDTIELTFTAGELDVARVDGLQRGIFLDPVTDDGGRTTNEENEEDGTQG